MAGGDRFKHGIMRWIIGLADASSWWPWVDAKDDLIEYREARTYVENWNRNKVERFTDGEWVPQPDSTEKLKRALDIVYRRVSNGASDGTQGGGFRTMSRSEYRGSEQQAKAKARYEQMVAQAKTSAIEFV